MLLLGAGVGLFQVPGDGWETYGLSKAQLDLPGHPKLGLISYSDAQQNGTSLLNLEEVKSHLFIIVIQRI